MGYPDPVVFIFIRRTDRGFVTPPVVAVANSPTFLAELLGQCPVIMPPTDVFPANQTDTTSATNSQAEIQKMSLAASSVDCCVTNRLICSNT